MAKAGYYAYLRRFSPYHLRTYQSGFYADMARRSQWEHLVASGSSQHMGGEDYISLRYRLPPWLTYFISMLGWCTFGLYLFYLIGFWEAKQHIFRVVDREHPSNPAPLREYVPKYQMLYNFDRPQRG